MFMHTLFVLLKALYIVWHTTFCIDKYNYSGLWWNFSPPSELLKRALINV